MLEYLHNQENVEKRKLIPFFEQHYIEWIPYFWIDEYDLYDEEKYIKIEYDNQNGMYYVDWHGKKLYWRRDTKK